MSEEAEVHARVEEVGLESIDDPATKTSSSIRTSGMDLKRSSHSSSNSPWLLDNSSSISRTSGPRASEQTISEVCDSAGGPSFAWDDGCDLHGRRRTTRCGVDWTDLQVAQIRRDMGTDSLVDLYWTNCLSVRKIPSWHRWYGTWQYSSHRFWRSRRCRTCALEYAWGENMFWQNVGSWQALYEGSQQMTFANRIIRRSQNCSNKAYFQEIRGGRTDILILMGLTNCLVINFELNVIPQIGGTLFIQV